MNILSDQTVIPSYLGVQSRSSSPGATSTLNDYTLRFGEIKKVIYPDDETSYSKKSVEYDVDVQYRDGNGVYVTSRYRGVSASTMFGGVADIFEYTNRPDTNPQDSNKDIGNGNKVLLLCLSGDQQKAIILGGLKDPSDTRKMAQADGHNLFWEFNGIRVTINKDGEATLMFRGATNPDGTLNDGADSNAEGTQITFSKDGSFTASTPKEKQFIRLNNKDKKIEINADSQWSATVNGDLKFQVNKGIVINGSQGCTLSVNNNVNIQSQGVLIGDATDFLLKGSTYRSAEMAMHNIMQSAFQAMLTAASVMVVDVESKAVFAAFATTMLSALASFESNSQTYLSVKNKSD